MTFAHSADKAISVLSAPHESYCAVSFAQNARQNAAVTSVAVMKPALVSIGKQATFWRPCRIQPSQAPACKLSANLSAANLGHDGGKGTHTSNFPSGMPPHLLISCVQPHQQGVGPAIADGSHRCKPNPAAKRQIAISQTKQLGAGLAFHCYPTVIRGYCHRHRCSQFGHRFSRDGNKSERQCLSMLGELGSLRLHWILPNETSSQQQLAARSVECQGMKREATIKPLCGALMAT